MTKFLYRLGLFVLGFLLVMIATLKFLGYNGIEVLPIYECERRSEMIFGIDFDGPCVEHKYPDIGINVPFAVSSLNMLAGDGHQLILWTMRSDEPLDHAVHWFNENNIELFGINGNPSQHNWTDSPKAYCHQYIDDAAVGCPLRDGIQGPRKMVDWKGVMTLLGYRV